MKRSAALFIALFVFLYSSEIHPQNIRYRDIVFDTVTIDSGITFSEIVSGDAIVGTLKMDIFQPAQDTTGIRPAIVFVHGGSFFGGTRSDIEIGDWAQRFARRGYVTASIDYRLGLDEFSRIGFIRAIYRGVQDARAAIRFIRANHSLYGIDSSRIIVGGISAGAMISIHHGFWNSNEIPEPIDTNLLGGLDNIGGNPGVSSLTLAVVNIAGAIGDTSWIDANGTSVVNVHGTADMVVPYAAGGAFGIALLPIFGSKLIHETALQNGIHSELLTLEGVGHDIAINSPTADSVVDFIARFLYSTIDSANSSISNTLLFTRKKSARFNLLPLFTGRKSHNAGQNTARYDLKGRVVHINQQHCKKPLVSQIVTER